MFSTIRDMVNGISGYIWPAGNTSKNLGVDVESQATLESTDIEQPYLLLACSGLLEIDETSRVHFTITLPDEPSRVMTFNSEDELDQHLAKSCPEVDIWKISRTQHQQTSEHYKYKNKFEELKTCTSTMAVDQLCHRDGYLGAAWRIYNISDRSIEYVINHTRYWTAWDFKHYSATEELQFTQDYTEKLARDQRHLIIGSTALIGLAGLGGLGAYVSYRSSLNSATSLDSAPYGSIANMIPVSISQPILLNDGVTTGNQESPLITSNPSGTKFIVGATGDTTDQTDVFITTLDYNGNVIIPMKQANVYSAQIQTANTIIFTNETTTAAIWYSSFQAGTSYDLWGTEFDENLNPVNPEERQNETTTSIQSNAVIIVDQSSGNVWETWGSLNQVTSGLSTIVLRQVDKDLASIPGTTMEIIVPDDPNRSHDYPHAIYNSGKIILGWESFYGTNQVHFKIYDPATGNATTSQLNLSTHTAGNQSAVKLAALDNGDFAGVFHSTCFNDASCPDGAGLYLRLFDSAGVAYGNEILIESIAPTTASLITISKNTLVVQWRDGVGDIISQLYKVTATPTAGLQAHKYGAKFSLPKATPGVYQRPTAAPLAEGKFVTAAQGPDIDQDGIWGWIFHTLMTDQFSDQHYTGANLLQSLFQDTVVNIQGRVASTQGEVTVTCTLPSDVHGEFKISSHSNVTISFANQVFSMAGPIDAINSLFPLQYIAAATDPADFSLDFTIEDGLSLPLQQTIEMHNQPLLTVAGLIARLVGSASAITLVAKLVSTYGLNNGTPKVDPNSPHVHEMAAAIGAPLNIASVRKLDHKRAQKFVATITKLRDQLNKKGIDVEKLSHSDQQALYKVAVDIIHDTLTSNRYRITNKANKLVGYRAFYAVKTINQNLDKIANDIAAKFKQKLKSQSSTKLNLITKKPITRKPRKSRESSPAALLTAQADSPINASAKTKRKRDLSPRQSTDDLVVAQTPVMVN